MKIIKEGKKIVGTMRVTCEKCEAELELVASDLKEDNGDGVMLIKTYSYTCPCCQRTHCISYNTLNEDILFDIEHLPK